MSRMIKVAAIQASFGLDLDANIARTAELIREAAGRGAQVILPPELFQGPYFCVAQEERWFKTAHPWREHPCVTALAPLAAELGVVLPISIFEREGPHYFNSLVMADADGSLLGVYRKSRHIPRRARLYGEVLLPAWATPASRSGTKPLRGASASASAGTSGTRRPPGPWR